MQDTQSTRTDFMAISFQSIGEPLNLKRRGQAWFERIYRSQDCVRHQTGLVLGATQWMANLLANTCQDVLLIDQSARMLDSAEKETKRTNARNASRIRYLRQNWLDLSCITHPVDIVFADNSFLFLSFPADWRRLCHELASRTSRGATLMARIPSVPLQHTSQTIEEIVSRFEAQEEINYTEVRTTLLFSHWNRDTYAIDTEEALANFEAKRDLFDALFRKFTVAEDDLTTIQKYRSTGTIYYAPPVSDITEVLDEYFDIRQVVFGRYPMAQYFPLFVAQRK